MELKQDIYSTQEVADLLRVSKQAVCRWIQGRNCVVPLKAYRFQKTFRVERGDLAAFLERHSSVPELAPVRKPERRGRKKKFNADKVLKEMGVL